MRRLGITILAGAALLLGTRAANAQFFNITASNFIPTPPGTPTNTIPGSAGGTLTVNLGTPANGGFAGTFGTDYVWATPILTNSAVIDPASESIVNTGFTVDITVQPATNAAGTPSPGTSPVTHTFSGRFSGTMSQGTSNISADWGNGTIGGVTLPGNPQTYTFSDGSFFNVFLFQFTSPSFTSGAGGGGVENPGSANLHILGRLGTVPEPGSIAMLVGSGLGSGLLLFRRRRRA